MIMITIETGNAAFAEDRDDEVSRILTKLVREIKLYNFPITLHDVNGNRVGTAAVVDTEQPE